MNFAEFKALRTEMDVDAFNAKYGHMVDYGDTKPEAIMAYDGFYIERSNVAQVQEQKGTYHLLLGRDEYVSDDLNLLEGILWFDFAAFEMNNGKETLHEVARDFMDWAKPDAEPMSLDEWMVEHDESLTPVVKRIGSEILGEFEGYGGEA